MYFQEKDQDERVVVWGLSSHHEHIRTTTVYTFLLKSTWGLAECLFNNQDCSLSSFDLLCFSRSLIVYFIIFFLLLWLFSTCLSISCEFFYGRKSPNLCFIWNIVNTYWNNYVSKWVLQSKYIKIKFISPVYPV